MKSVSVPRLAGFSLITSSPDQIRAAPVRPPVQVAADAPLATPCKMADVDSLLSELDGLLKNSPPGQRPPQRPSAAPAAPRLAPGRPAVEDDIDSLLSSLGGAEAFSSNAASKTTCAPRAACPPSAVPSSSSAPPDGTSCATKYVPAARLPAPPLCPSTPHPRPCPASSVAACGAASATSR